MTYTVKNGTWCKDNDKEYYSTTKTGLKAALKAGEIQAGTKVVVHEPKYHAGQLIQSLNPNCPEGCFVPDGSAIDPVYEELIAVVGPNLPDMRECVLVMAGQNTHITTHAHDVFSAGEFKDDQAQLVEHDHAITDPGHAHEITDPGHDHGRGTQNITGQIGSIGVGGTISGAFYMSGEAEHIKQDGDPDIQVGFDASRTWTGRSETVETGISVDSATTGITIVAKGDNNVTRTKQFGVYYYIAF